ncbi:MULTISPECIES: ATP-binding protein [unclassified Phenylobacterium]|uniref:hybrid sensor histidine kinase/response regulator n=1 Tax=unclassified Phenylobacterium TaxID=2640670 RepID=UPI0009E793AA|nr:MULTISPECIES: ATP-binding protein [unclassified Phenylobacterium]
MRRESEFRLLAPLVALALGAMAVFVASLLIWARQVDEDVRLREIALVERGILTNIAEIERSILPETNWDEAIVNLDNRFNAAWADANLNDYFAQNIDFEHLFVLDGDNRALYARHHRKTVDPSSFLKFRGAESLIARVRRAEAERGPIAQRDIGAPRQIVSHAIQASDFVARDGAVYLVSATLVQPDFATAVPSRPYAPIVIMALKVDPNSLGKLQERLQLYNLRSSVGRSAAAPGDAEVVLPTGAGQPPLILSWTPHKPGAELARAAVLPVALVLLAFGLVGAVMIARIRAAAIQFVVSHKSQSEFLANMSHEIRTPLNGVNAIAAALGRTPLNPSQAEMVGIIQGSGESLERLLSDVLDLSQIETGAVEVVERPFHLGDAIRAVAALAGTRAQEKALDVIVDLDPAAETVVAGDSVRLKQVLLNLVSNAVKFTSEGYVAIAVRADGPDRWRIDVQDTGIGFDPADKARLFSRFEQGDRSRTRRYSGAGLGLTIAKQLIDLMGGEIDATGAPGEGATFTVRLPMAITHAPVDAQAEPEADAAPDRPLRVLLADDHPTNRKVVQVLFAELPVDLVCVENGEQACEAFAFQRFDLVLMDMQMPVMDGLTAVRAIRERERMRGLGQTPIVMLTANALPSHQAASLAAGADLHMAKPIEAAKLFGVLQAVADRQGLAAAA